MAAQALDDLEHEVERVLADPGPLGHVRAQTHPGEDRLDRVTRAQVRDLLDAGGGAADEEWGSFYSGRAARELYDWLVGHGVEFEFLRPQEHDSVPRWHSPRGAGWGIMERLRHAIDACGLADRLRPSIVVEDLLWDDGEVVGVSGRSHGGTAYECRGTAVVMATGGFAGNSTWFGRTRGDWTWSSGS